MEILAKLFGPVRLKVLRFFLQHQEGAYEDKDMAKRLKVSLPQLRKELKILESVGFLKHRIAHAVLASTRNGKRSFKGWYLQRLLINGPLKKFLFNSVPFKNDEVIKRLKGIGKIKLLIVAGVFIQDDSSPIDIMIVGDQLRRVVSESALRTMEADIGRELNYALFETHDFLYRLEAYDKFVREVFESPHQRIIDRIGLKAQE